jgi:hypothetical protein
VNQLAAATRDERTELAAMLMFLQAAIGLVTVFGAMIVSFAFASPGMGIMTIVMLTGSGLWVLLGAGLVRRRPWARRGTLAAQWLGVAGGVIGLLLQVGTGLSLVAMCTNLGLPLLVIHLLRAKGEGP